MMSDKSTSVAWWDSNTQPGHRLQPHVRAPLVVSACYGVISPPASGENYHVVFWFGLRDSLLPRRERVNPVHTMISESLKDLRKESRLRPSEVDKPLANARFGGIPRGSTAVFTLLHFQRGIIVPPLKFRLGGKPD